MRCLHTILRGKDSPSDSLSDIFGACYRTSMLTNNKLHVQSSRHPSQSQPLPRTRPTDRPQKLAPAAAGPSVDSQGGPRDGGPPAENDAMSCRRRVHRAATGRRSISVRTVSAAARPLHSGRDPNAGRAAGTRMSPHSQHLAQSSVLSYAAVSRFLHTGCGAPSCGAARRHASSCIL